MTDDELFQRFLSQKPRRGSYGDDATFEAALGEWHTKLRRLCEVCKISFRDLPVGIRISSTEERRGF